MENCKRNIFGGNGMGLKLSEYMQRAPYLAEILRELPQELVQTILIRTYCAGDVIVQRCEEGMDVYIVLEGVCCATCNFVNGERSWFRKRRWAMCLACRVSASSGTRSARPFSQRPAVCWR